jgi:hypothetical protein
LALLEEKMASRNVIPISSTKFQLDKTIVAPGGSITVDIGASTSHDVVDAILENKPFPDRPDGKIEIGSIDLKAETGKTFAFNAGPSTIGFTASAELKTGMGVFNSAADALASLDLEDAPQLTLSIPGASSDKYLVLLWGYDVAGSFSGSHPIGVLGSLTFGAEAARDSLYAVMHRFPAATDARTAIADTLASWRFPRQLKQARDLKPGSWLIAEIDGSLAVHISAQLGYDFNMVRQAKLLGLTRNLGAKIDAGLKVTFGFDVSGRYLLVVGRESPDDSSTTVRLQLFKQSQKGLDFGLNLSVGITGENDLPADIDGLVEAVFGVHGLQAVKDLHLIEQWTDPNADLGQTAARLLNHTGLKLLTTATGVDAAKQFNKARQLVLDELGKWDALPDKVSAATWKILGDLGRGTGKFKTFLTALADDDPATRNAAFASALQDATFGDTAQGQWLAAIADQGLLALSGKLDKVQPVAAQTLDILNGGIVKKLQDFIADKLDLSKIRDAVTQNDFDKVDSWLLKRLGDFFDKDLHFDDLDQIKAAINLVVTRAQDIYGKAQKALNSRYNFEFAAAYMKNTTATALLDVNFDLQQTAAADMFRKVVDESDFDDLLVQQTQGVTLNMATLSHDIKRTGTVQLNMPMFSFDSQHVNESLAKVTAEEDGGRVLVYELNASDSVTVKNRYRSELSVLGSLQARNGQLAMLPDSTQSIAYQSRQVKPAMSLADFEHRVTPFVHEYLPQLFSGNESSLQTFYLDLDRTVENVLHNGANQFGDVALDMQVSVSSSVLGSWFIRRNPDRLKQDSMVMSLALQAKLRKLLPFCYFQDVSRLRANPTAAALLVWAAMPVSTSIDFQDGQIRRFNTNNDVYWDFVDIDLRRAVASDSHTTGPLAAALLSAQTRLREAGDDRNAAFFTAQQAGTFQNMTRSGMGDTLLQSLLFTEAEIIGGATAALKDVNRMLDAAATAPTKAIERFADFGADLTDTFNHKLSSVYGSDALRTLSSMVLIEASRAIDPDLSTQQPQAMLNILTFQNSHKFDLNDFIAGAMPPKEQIVVAQTLVSLSS